MHNLLTKSVMNAIIHTVPIGIECINDKEC